MPSRVMFLTLPHKGRLITIADITASQKGKMNQVWQARDEKYFQGKDGSHAEEEEQHQSTRF